MNTVAIIPCHNEAQAISQIISETRKHVDRVIVIDNLSSDHTAQKASAAKAEVYYCPRKGMGAALYCGIAKSLDADAVVTLDGDLQHDPDDIPALLAPIAANQADIVIGIRTDNAAMPIYRRFGNAIISATCYLGHSRYTDAQCGFRAFTGRTAAKIVCHEPGFGCITEFIIKARKANLKIAYVPVSCRYNTDLKSNSTMNPVYHGASVFFKTMRWRVWEFLGI